MKALLTLINFTVWLAFGLAGTSSEPTIHLITFVFLLAPLFLVPWAAGLLTRTSVEPLSRMAWIWPAWALVISFSLPFGWTAGLLAVPWLASSLWLAGRVTLAWRQRLRSLEAIACSAAGLYLVVGSGWLVISRCGLRPLGFETVIVLLTAVHFHFAGLAAVTIIGRLYRYVPRSARRPYQVAVAGAVGGTPVLAAGITLSPLLELVGAGLLVAAMMLVAGLLIFVVIAELDYWPAQAMLGGAAGFLAIGMVLAMGYAVAEFEELPMLPIPLMAALHGVANGIGFCGLGMLGLVLLDRSERLRVNS